MQDYKSVIGKVSWRNQQSRALGQVFCNIRISVRGQHGLRLKVKLMTSILSTLFKLWLIFRSLNWDQVQAIPGVTQPWGVAIYQQQTATSGSRVWRKKISKGGKRVQTIECDKFRDLQGVATASDGTIYVTDIGVKCLFKFSKEGWQTSKNCLKYVKIPFFH